VIYGAKVHTYVLPILFALGVLGFLGIAFIVGSIVFGVTLLIKLAFWILLLPLWIILIPIQILVWFVRGFFGVFF
jgi:hypothetical protein